MALPYEIVVGLRYLRAKRRNRTISLNTVVSVTGITFGVAALIGTVGIMTGFKEDIQAKILGTTAHIIVQDRTKDGMTDYDATGEQVETVPNVVSATPFILKQVMLTTPNGAQGVVLRGVDPVREGKVTALAQNLVSGNLEDLGKPIPVKLTSESTNHPVRCSYPKNPASFSARNWPCVSGRFTGDTINVVSPAGTDQCHGHGPENQDVCGRRAFFSPACTNTIRPLLISTLPKPRSFSTWATA